MKKYAFEGEFTADNVLAFHTNYVDGKLQPYFRSEAIPETNDEPVKVVVGKTFNDIVMDSTKDVLIEFYAPWCGHCKQVEIIINLYSFENSSLPSMMLWQKNYLKI